MIKGLPLLLIALALAGCGGPDTDRASDEARQLDEAAAATDINATRANESQP